MKESSNYVGSWPSDEGQVIDPTLAKASTLVEASVLIKASVGPPGPKDSDLKEFPPSDI